MSSTGTLEHGVKQKRTPVRLRGFALLTLSFQTLGIIYSDIGTSPLYVLNGIWPGTGDVPSEEDIIGGISAIIWAMTLLPLLKYVFIALSFGTQEGEGGSFALYQGLYPPVDKDYDDDRTLTGDSFGKPRSKKSTGLKETFRWPLLVWCLFGTSLTMADGVFTPAVSVTSAVGGLAVAKPEVTKHITPISIGFLVALFLGQRFGTSKVAFTFAPISFLWFLLLAGTGIYNITRHPGIFRAFDPSRAVLLFVRTKDYGLLAGVLLALTGCEAMFANLGQFNALSIQLSFSLFVYPSLILAYLGQGARLIVDGETVLSNLFYQTIPGPLNGGLYWLTFVLAILATIVASQALISATFSLVQQVVNMKGLPPIRMIYTSDTIQGQIYIPAVNWTLMVIIIVIVAAFTDLANMTNAYGFAVATVMFSTSVLIAIQMRYVKRWPVIIGIIYFLVFGFFDALFWGASLQKVPHGAWVPLLIGLLCLMVMTLWTWAKGLEDDFDGANRCNLRHFIRQGEKGSVTVNLSAPASESYDEDEFGKDSKFYYLSHPKLGYNDEKNIEEIVPTEEQKELQRIPTCAIFHKMSSGKGVPHTFVGFIRQWPALPRVVIFLSVCVVPVARVPVEDRYALTKVRSINGFYGVTYYLGFRDDFDVKVDDLIERICALEMELDPRQISGTVKEIRKYTMTTTHIVPHYHVVSRKVNVGKLSVVVNWLRAVLVESLYRRLATMFPETANWLTPADEIIHVGINAVI